MNRPHLGPGPYIDRKDSKINSMARNHVPNYGEADQALQRRMTRELEARNAQLHCPVCGVKVETVPTAEKPCGSCFGR